MCVTRLSVTEFCVKDVTCGEWCVWQSSVWQMICDTVVSGKLVSARWCVAKVVGGTVCVCRCFVSVWNMLCDTDGVWQSFMWWSSVWKMACQTCMWQSCVKKMWKRVCDRWCVFDRCCVAKTVCDRVSMWQNYVWWMVCVSSCKWQSRVWKMVGDKVVCEWWRLTTWCVPDCVWQSFWKILCCTVVVDRCPVTKWCVTDAVSWSDVWPRCDKVVFDRWCETVCDKVVGSKQSETTSHCFERRRKSETHLCQTLQPWKMNKN